MDLNKNASFAALRDLLEKKAGHLPGLVMGVVAGDGSLKDFVDSVSGGRAGSFGVFDIGRDEATARDQATQAYARADYAERPRHGTLRYKSDVRDGTLVIGVAVAGVHEDDIEVNVTDETVAVSAKFYDCGDVDGSLPVIRSFEYDLDPDDGEAFVASGVKATLKRGLLSLVVPIKQPVPVVGERIKIKVG